ncbi:hypothetical protein Tco_1065596 [Tanacetum coccineum]
MQSKEGKVDSRTSLDIGLVVTESNETESEKHVSSSRSGKDTHAKDANINSVNDQVPLVESKDVQMQEGKVDMESSGTMLDEQDTSSRSRNDADTEDAVIRPVNDQVSLVEVQLTTPHNVLVNEQHHSVQSEPSYDTHLLEKVDSNTIPDSTNMCHRGGEIVLNAEKCQVSCPLLNPSFDNMTTEFSNQSLDKTVENADLKAQIQEKVFANVALKNELRKLKGNSVDTKFAKPSILGKPVLQPPRYQSVVRQPNAFKSERPNFSKPRFASQVDVNNERVSGACTANHDACITKFLKEVNSRAKIQPNKTRNSNKPVDPTSHTQKPGRKIVTGHSFSPNKSSAVHEKTNTPRSYLRWIPTGRIFNTAGLKWVPTGTTFTSSTTKVDCELPNGSNDCITNPYKCDQTLNVSAGTLNLSAGTFCNPEKERLGVCLLKKVIYQKPRVPGIYAPLLKEKKSVRFSALFLQKKRNLLVS